MKIHLVGGFLGSGKTTAIINACRELARRGERPGVITNDQGKYLVDSAFVKAADLPSVEVGGGCFCCNYTDYRSMIDRIESSSHPTHLFAESVGSCADIVATVIKPSELESAGHIASFSVFADIRLIRLWLAGGRFPFGDEIVYLFRNQLEEAQVIVINKADLLGAEECESVRLSAADRFPGKTVRLQSSLAEPDICSWLDLVEGIAGSPAQSSSLEIDYPRYGAAEASMAWYDATVSISASATGHSSSELVAAFARSIHEVLAAERRSVGHVKLFASGAGRSAKVSVTAVDEPAAMPVPTGDDLRSWGSGPVEVVVNARVETSPDELSRTVRSALASCCGAQGRAFSIVSEDSFSPSFPHPTHRIG